MSRFINFESINETPMRLTREDDGEILLTIYDSEVPSMAVAEVYIDPDVLREHLREIQNEEF
ncbi:hypothetical protein [Microbispora sp. NPDC049125]|uniref:hypothetical protein n=1 Tax=Microbispora sp. NPDC049125 TaxID=3154929 RepID=UPI0034673743